MKKYIKNLGISASIIAIANINKASEKKTGAITIVFDGKEYKDDVFSSHHAGNDYGCPRPEDRRKTFSSPTKTELSLRLSVFT